MTENNDQSAASIRARFMTTAIVVDPALRSKGRPKILTIGQFSESRASAWAIAVFKEMQLLGGLRGSQAAAIAKIARREPSYSRATKTALELRIKQAVKRYPNAKVSGRFLGDIEGLSSELERRMLGFPDDIRAFFRPMAAMRVLLLLREADVDGTCPAEWVAEIRKPSD